MCLDTVTWQTATPSQEVVVAWKAFNYARGPEGELRCFNTTVPKGKWIRAANTPAAQDERAQYILGFHAWTTREAARAWTGRVRKVMLRGIRTKGRQSDYQVLVADELMVTKEWYGSERGKK